MQLSLWYCVLVMQWSWVCLPLKMFEYISSECQKCNLSVLWATETIVTLKKIITATLDCMQKDLICEKIPIIFCLWALNALFYGRACKWCCSKELYICSAFGTAFMVNVCRGERTLGLVTMGSNIKKNIYKLKKKRQNNKLFQFLECCWSNWRFVSILSSEAVRPLAVSEHRVLVMLLVWLLLCNCWWKICSFWKLLVQ